MTFSVYDEKVDGIAREIARGRMLAAQRDGLRPNVITGDPEEAHVFGALGEVLAALELGIPIQDIDRGGGCDGGVDFTLPDGRTVQVRTRDLRGGRNYDDLISQETGIVADLAVLVLIYHDRRCLVAGWTTRDEFERKKQPGVLVRADGMKLYYMRRSDLWPISTLKESVKCPKT